MGYSSTDAYGAYTDTGCASAPTARTNTEVEMHLSTEVDTGSKNSVTLTIASHQPHRPATAPR
jgi:hypothetical protein